MSIQVLSAVPRLLSVPALLASCLSAAVFASEYGNDEISINTSVPKLIDPGVLTTEPPKHSPSISGSSGSPLLANSQSPHLGGFDSHTNILEPTRGTTAPPLSEAADFTFVGENASIIANINYTPPAQGNAKVDEPTTPKNSPPKSNRNSPSKMTRANTANETAHGIAAERVMRVYYLDDEIFNRNVFAKILPAIFSNKERLAFSTFSTGLDLFTSFEVELANQGKISNLAGPTIHMIFLDHDLDRDPAFGAIPEDQREAWRTGAQVAAKIRAAEIKAGVPKKRWSRIFIYSANSSSDPKFVSAYKSLYEDPYVKQALFERAAQKEAEKKTNGDLGKKSEKELEQEEQGVWGQLARDLRIYYNGKAPLRAQQKVREINDLYGLGLRLKSAQNVAKRATLDAATIQKMLKAQAAKTQISVEDAPSNDSGSNSGNDSGSNSGNDSGSNSGSNSGNDSGNNINNNCDNNNCVGPTDVASRIIKRKSKTLNLRMSNSAPGTPRQTQTLNFPGATSGTSIEAIEEVNTPITPAKTPN